MTTESLQLAETLALQTSKYMVAAWKVTGEPKAGAESVAASEKLDYELFQRWIRFLAKPPKFYPYLKKWQDMVKEGGSEDEAKALAGEFQDLVDRACCSSRARSRTRTTSSGPRRCPARRRRSGRTFPTSSSPTTTSAPAAASS